MRGHGLFKIHLSLCPNAKVSGFPEYWHPD